MAPLPKKPQKCSTQQAAAEADILSEFNVRRRTVDDIAQIWEIFDDTAQIWSCCSSDNSVCVQFFATPWTAAHQASLSLTISWRLLKLMSIESVIPSNHLVLCCPLLFLPSIFPSIRIFSYESALHIRWPKYWSFNFSVSPSSAYSGLTSLKIDWFDLLAVQGTLKSLLQHHSSKASILWHSAFFMAQLSQSCMTTGKTIDLTIWTFVSKVMSLLFNTLSKFATSKWKGSNNRSHSSCVCKCGRGAGHLLSLCLVSFTGNRIRPACFDSSVGIQRLKQRITSSEIIQTFELIKPQNNLLWELEYKWLAGSRQPLCEL